MAGRAVVLDGHAVFAAAGGGRAGARRQGVDAQRRGAAIWSSAAAQDLDQLRAAAVKRGFKAVPLKLRAAATLQQRSSRKTSPNVIGVLKGANEQQAVVFTSHYDHFGMRDPQPGDKPDTDRIFNGAYDNASGVAGLLMIAQAMARARAEAGRAR